MFKILEALLLNHQYRYYYVQEQGISASDQLNYTFTIRLGKQDKWMPGMHCQVFNERIKNLTNANQEALIR